MLEKYQDLIDATIKDYIEIKVQSSESLTLGDSKFGGRPYLPYGMNKPVYMGQEMSLLAQLNLAQIPKLSYAKTPDYI